VVEVVEVVDAGEVDAGDSADNENIDICVAERIQVQI
jgi:hypothetical protein